MGRILALGALAAVMVIVMILTWGSLGSAVMGLCLIAMGAALLYRRFLNREDADQWDL